MSTEVKVPQLPESVADATLVSWHKKVGDTVRRDENLVDLETDKVVLEVPCPTDGTLKEIKVEDGATVTSGELLAVVEAGSVEAAAAPAQAPAEQPAEAVSTASPAASADSGSDGKSADKFSPSVRRLIQEHDLDPSRISGSGPDGRITKADVLRHIDSDSDGAAEDLGSETGTIAVGAARNERRVPMTRLRATIAKRMVEAQQNAAMLTTFNEVDLTEVIALRARYKDSFADTHGAKLGFMSFFVRAAVEALRRFPSVNASIDGNDIVYHDYQDIGIAVSTERGLMVPVVRDCGLKSFAQIEKDIAEYGRKAREGSISLDDLTGGTFTITNGGIFGSMMSTPILNPPQTGILGMHSIMDRPIVVDGEIKIRKMMYLAMSYDHRLIDGKEAVQFVVTIKNALEDPGRLLLQV
ncbi:MAG: 2-oxoglutarate dehydrogenase complex dihydrolipoyllysine-residue succinyltransferase [Pseudomonadota bacterium]